MEQRQTAGEAVRERVKDALADKAPPVTQVTDATVCQMAATVASGLVMPLAESGVATWQDTVQQAHMAAVAKLAVTCARAIADEVAKATAAPVEPEKGDG